MMKYKILIYLWSLAVTTLLVLVSGLRYDVHETSLIVFCSFVTYFLYTYASRTFDTIYIAYRTKSISEKIIHDFYRFSFSALYLALIFYLPMNIDLIGEKSPLLKGGFTVETFYEVILLIVLLLLAVVSYRRCLTDFRTARTEFITSTIKAAMALFTTHAVVLICPWVKWNNFEDIFKIFLHPIESFNDYRLVDIFLFDNNSIYIFVTKLILLGLANFQLHLLKKYYTNYFVSHNFFVILLMLLWLNLFLLGVDNMILTIAMFDVISMATAAFIVMHEKEDEFIFTRASLFYFFSSCFTSICGYIGSFLLYAQYQSFSFQFYFMLFEHGDVSLPNGFVALGWFFISIKLIFLLGCFPFYKYVVDVGSIIFFPSIYYWSVVSKLAVLFNIVKFICIVQYIDRTYFIWVWIVVLTTSIIYASFSIANSPKLKVFFAYSSMVNISTTILFATLDWKSSVFVVLISFLIYAFAMFGLILFLSCAKKVVPFSNVRDGSEVDVFENLHWSAQEIVFAQGLDEPGVSNDFHSFLAKGGTGICVLILMGAAPFSGFLMKFLIVSAFVSIQSFLVAAALLLSTVFTHLTYYGMFTSITEKAREYVKHSYNEWVTYVDEDDLMYFQLVLCFNLFASIFCLILVF